MEESIFKVGQVVHIRQLNSSEKLCYPSHVNEPMLKHSGKLAHITRVVKVMYGNKNQHKYYMESYAYKIDIDDNAWKWDAAMFKECEPPITPTIF